MQHSDNFIVRNADHSIWMREVGIFEESWFDGVSY